MTTPKDRPEMKTPCVWVVECWSDDFPCWRIEDTFFNRESARLAMRAWKESDYRYRVRKYVREEKKG